jgi:hypothetical protein
MLEVSLPLYSNPVYSYFVNLEGDSYKLLFTYNETMKLYTLSIYDQDSEPIKTGLGLVPNYPIGRDYIIKNLTGGFVLLPKGTSVDVEYYKLYPDKIDRYYTLSYVYGFDTTE